MSKVLRVPVAMLVFILSLSAGAALADEAMLPVEWDADSGRVLLEIRSFDQPLLYTNTLATGLGTSSPGPHSPALAVSMKNHREIFWKVLHGMRCCP